MHNSLLLRRFLEHPPSRAKALKFLRAVSAEGNRRLVLRSSGPDDPLDDLVREVSGITVSPGAISAYLAVPENREFAKLFLVFLVSSTVSFQPNVLEDWTPFQKLIDEIIVEGLVYIGGESTGPRDPCELLLDDLGFSLIKTKLQELVA